MKILSALAATAVALTGVTAAAPASAQHRVVVRERAVVRHHRRTVCNWQQRNHHRVRVCRTVR